jgi:transcriptional regulator with XRE-family HTH domain
MNLMDRDDLIAHIRLIINERHGGLQSDFAQNNKISSAYINDILQGRREPGQKVLDAIGFEKVVTYQKI